MEPQSLIPAGAVDTGETEMIIKSEGGRVIVRFREPRLWVAMDPSNAVQIGKHLIDCAVSCGANVVVQLPRREITNAKRNRLIARATHVYRSLQERGAHPATIAKHVVDTILSAID